MLHVEKRGCVWWVYGQVNGRRYHQSLKTADRTVAESLKRDLELQLLSGGRVRRMLWPDFTDEFESWIAPNVKPPTLKVYRRIIGRFGKFLLEQKALDVSAVTPAVVAEYMEDRRKDRHPTRGELIGNEGIKADLRVLHRVLAYAVDCNYLAANPIRYRRLSTTGGKTLPFADDELAALLNDRIVKSRPYLRAVVLTFLFTGMRISDVMQMSPKALEISEGAMILRTIKRGRSVSLGVHPELRQALDLHLRNRTAKQKASPYLFATKTGGVPTSLDTMLTRLFKRCEIVNGHPHRFRDTFAIRLLANGASLYDVAKMLGIDVATAEKHYAPYVKELQERSTRLIAQLQMPGKKVVQFCVPLGVTSSQIDQTESETEGQMEDTQTAVKS